MKQPPTINYQPPSYLSDDDAMHVFSDIHEQPRPDWCLETIGRTAETMMSAKNLRKVSVQSETKAFAEDVLNINLSKYDHPDLVTAAPLAVVRHFIDVLHENGEEDILTLEDMLSLHATQKVTPGFGEDADIGRQILHMMIPYIQHWFTHYGAWRAGWFVGDTPDNNNNHLDHDYIFEQFDGDKRIRALMKKIYGRDWKRGAHASQMGGALLIFMNHALCVYTICALVGHADIRNMYVSNAHMDGLTNNSVDIGPEVMKEYKQGMPRLYAGTAHMDSTIFEKFSSHANKKVSLY